MKNIYTNVKAPGQRNVRVYLNVCKFFTFKILLICISFLCLANTLTAQTVQVTDSNVSCAGGSDGTATANVTAGVPPYTYLWSNAQTTQVITGLTIGVYSVTITDAIGGTANGGSIVSQPPILSKNISITEISCNGASDGAISMTVSGGTPPYIFDWDNDGIGDNDDSAYISNLGAGIHTIVITDANGCQTSASVNLEEDPPILAAPLVTNVSCNGGTDGGIVLVVSGGAGIFQYDWDIDGTGDFDDTKNLTNIPAGTYSVTIQDHKGCTHFISGQLLEPAPINLNAIVTNISCNGLSDGAINLTPSGGTAPYTFSWSGGLGNSEDVSGLGVGTYDVTVTDANGCPHSESFTITEATPLTATATSTNASCNNTTNGTIDLTVNGGTTPYTYLWSNGMIVEDPANLNNGSYTVTITDANGCTTTASATINSPAPITITALPNEPGCYGDNTGSLDITAVGGTTPYTYVWSNTNTFEDLFGVPAGTYIVTVTDVNGCVGTQSFTINQPLQMTVDLGPDQNLCAGNNMTLTPTVNGGTPAYIYSWDNGLGFGPTKTINPSATTTYSITVTDDTGCTTENSVTITVDACDFDLALTKKLATGQASTVSPGDVVSFEITVINQGQVDATNVSVLDYVDLADWAAFSTTLNPNGTTTGAVSLNYAWTMVGTNAKALLGGVLPAGASISFPVTLVVAPGISGLLTNEAEIYTDNNSDIDSQPESIEGDLNIDVVVDDEVNNTGGDEDDHDIASVTASIYDIALRKELAPGQAAAVSPGDKVDFLITVFNQGTVWANNVSIVDYIDLNAWDPFSLGDNSVGVTGGVVALNYNWQTFGTTARASIIGAIPPGQFITIPVTLTVKSGVTGTLYNYAEIFEDNGVDIDSQTEFEEGDGSVDVLVDDIIDNTGGDEDDHDVASIVSELYDLALKKEFGPGQYSTVESGDIVEFLITIYNQGSLPATGIDVIDYVDLTGWDPFDPALNPNGITGGNVSMPYSWSAAGTNGLTTLNNAIPGNSSVTFPVFLKVKTGANGMLSNYAEIYQDNGNDVDSQPEFEEIDGSADPLVDDIIDNTSGDEDDHDVAIVEAYLYDLALKKEIAAGQNVNIDAGSKVTFSITVYNQGDVPATGIQVVDYIDPAMWQPFFLPDNLAGTTTGTVGILYSWTSNPGFISTTLTGAIPPGGQVTFPITLTAQNNICGWIDNYAEIYEDDGFDIDSQPEFWENDINADTLVNDVINNAAGDEDDHDIASVYVNKFDLAMTKELAFGQPSIVNFGDNITFTLTLTNQGDIDAYNINLIDYLPPGTTLVDPAWTAVGATQATYNIVGPIPGNGGTATVNITLNVGTGFTGTMMDNCAEITSASQTFNGSPTTDFDSTPDNISGNDGVVTDNEINNAAGDEDDHDCEIANVRQAFDLALVKELAVGQQSVVNAGDTVTFTITVHNQGLTPAFDVKIIDYIPTGLTYLFGPNPGWVPGAGIATYEIAGPIAAINGFTSVDISFLIDPTFQDSCVTNIAEIMFATDTTGGALITDGDSTPDNINTDIVGADNELNGASGDEDDHDIEKIYINRHDMALRKSTNQITPVTVYDDVTFTITVFNQGNVPLQNIDIIDYIPNGLALSPIDNNNWIVSGSDAVNTITSLVNPGDSASIDIVLRVQSVAAGGIATNFAEIFGFEDTAGVEHIGDDVDSNGDMTNLNEVHYDNIIDNTLGDEDDHDSERVIVEVFDLALVKRSNVTMPMSGDTISYSFTVYNQGILNAFDIDLIDYLPSDLIYHQSLNPDWTIGSGGNLMTTIDGPIFPGDSVTVNLNVQINPIFYGNKIVNIAEIADAAHVNGGTTRQDFDSTPDNINSDVIGGDNLLDSSNGDEDDHDPDTIMVQQVFDLALIKTANVLEVNLGDTINFFIGVINQGTLPAYDIQLVDYMPASLFYNQNGVATWMNVSGNQWTTTIAGPVPPGATAQVFMSVVVDPSFADMMMTNYAEIQGASSVVGGPVLFDDDSIFDNIDNNDVEGGDNFIDNANGDEDDHDWAKVIVCFEIVDVAVTDPTNCGISNGTITVTTTNTLSVVEYSINNGATWQTSNVFNGVPTGTHHVKARYPFGICEVDYGEVTLEVNDVPQIDDVAFTDPTDCSLTDGTITITASNATGMNYSIDGGLNWQTSNTFVNLAPGTYDVRVMNSTFSCEDIYGNVTINALVPPLLANTTSTDPTDCAVSDGTITINASGAQGIEYSIDGGASWQTSSTFNMLPAGTYDISIRNADGTCQIDDPTQIILTEPIAPTIDDIVMTDPLDCATDNGAIAITATPTTGNILEYSIDGGATWQMSGSFAGLPAGTYNVQVRNTDGTCVVAFTDFPVILNAPVVMVDIDQSDATICLTNSFAVTASGTVNQTWSVVSGDMNSLSCTNCQNPTMTPNVTTTYKVAVGISGTTCYAEDIITVTVEDPIIIAPIITHKICLDEESLSLQLSVPIDTFYITGTGNYTNAVITGDVLDFDILVVGASSDFTVELVSIYGCSVINTFTVNRKVLFTPEFQMPAAACEGIDIPIEYVGGAPSNSFLNWDLDGGQIVFSNPGSATVPAGSDMLVNWPTTGMKTVVLTINNEGCFISDSLTINIGAYLAETEPDTSICLGSAANLSVSAGATYQWSPATSLDNATIQNPIATPTTTTTYSVTVTDANGCSGEDNMTVTVNEINATVSADQTICEGESIELVATGGTTYLWSPSTNLNNPNISNPVATPVATATYMVTVTDTNNCSDQLSVTVFVNPNPIVDAGADMNICIGGNASLNATGATTYVWTPTNKLSNPNIANPTATPLVTTTYYVTGIDANGCSATDSVTVFVNDGFLVAAMDDVILCGNDNIVNASITANDNITSYTITTNTGSYSNDIISGPTLTFDAVANGYPTDFFVTITTQGNCVLMDTFTVNKNPLLSASFTVDQPTCIGENINVSYTGGGGNTSFLNWNLDGAFIVSSSNATATDPAFSDLVVSWTTGGSKTLILTVEEFGCIISDTMNITVGDVTASVTPNTDICEGASLQLVATGGVTYQWNPTTGLSDPNIANPIATPTVSTFYTVTVTDANGCSDETSTVVTILFGSSSAIADQTICAGSSVELFATGGTSYQWSPAASLDDATLSNPTASPTFTTTYSVTVTDANNCDRIEDVIVNVLPAPIVDAGPDVSICIGEKVGLSGTGGTNYSWSPSNTLVKPNTANPEASPTVTTTYTLTATDANGCTATDQVTVFLNDGYLITPAQDQTLCDDVYTTNVSVVISDSIQTYSITGNGTYANDNVSYNLLNFDATFVSDPSVFYVEMTTDGGCIVLDTFYLYKNENLNADFQIETPACVGENIDITYTGGASVNSFLSWQIAGGTYISQSPATATSPAGTDIVVQWTTGGIKDVVLTITESGCVVSDMVQVNVGDITAVAGPDISICPGASTQLTASGGTSYAWGPVAGLSDPNIANPLASPTTSTFYTVTVTDASGCTDEATTVVTLLFGTSSVIEDQTICQGSSVELFATGGTSYQWSPAASLDDSTLSNPTASPAFTTTYSVTVTDTNNCDRIEEVTVFVTPAPIVDAGPDASICIGETVGLNATGGVSYSWSPANTLVKPNTANPNASPTVNTTYTVTITDANGCTATDQMTIIVNDGYLITPISDQTLCGDELTTSVSVVASDSIDTYVITGNGAYANDNVTYNQLNFDATLVSFPSVFYIEMTTDNGCIFNDTFYLYKNDNLFADFDIETPACIGENVDINYTGGASVNSFLSWQIDGGVYISQSPATTTSPAGTNIVVEWASAGLKEVILTITESGCVISDTMQVNVGDVTAIAGPNKTICPGDSVQLAAAGGTSYAWGPVDGLSDPNIANPMASPTSSTFYTVTVTDASGCTDEATTIVTHAFTAGQVSPNQTICEGATTFLSASGGTSYLWTPATGLSANNISNPVASPTTTTTYTVAITSPDGCVTNHDVTISVQPEPSPLFVINPPFCAGNNLNLTYVGGASSASTLTWDIDDGTIVSSSTGTATDPAGANISANWNSEGTRIIQLSVTENGCTSADSVAVYISGGPKINISPDQVVCTGSTVQLSADGGGTYQWTPTAYINNSTIANPVATVNATTTYTVVVTDLNGCESTASVTLTAANDTATGGPDQTICDGNSVQLDASGGVTYQWSPANTLDNATIQNPTATPLVTTTYEVTITTASGCVTIDYVDVIVEPMIVADAGKDVAICEAMPIQLAASGGASYAWSPTTGLSDPTTANPIATPSSTTTYTVSVSNAGGCTGSDQVTVTVNPGFTVGVVTTPTHCCDKDGSITITPNGGVAPFTYNWSPFASSSNIGVGLDFGFYTITVTDAAGCEQVVTTQVGNDCDCELISQDVVYVDSTTTYVGCLPLPYDSISNYNIWQNGVPYSNGLFACEIDTLLLYSYALINGMGNNGPYYLDAWYCANGQVYNGFINNMQDLADSMNVWDPAGNWVHNPAIFSIVGGTTNDTHGNMLIRHIATNITATLMTNTTTYSSSTTITAGVPGGDHVFIIEDESTCCVDTLYVIENTSCPTLSIIPTTQVANCCDLNGVVTLSVTGGNAPYIYNWSTSASTTNEATNLPSGLHNITVTDSDGCTGQIEVSVAKDCDCEDIYPDDEVYSEDGTATLCVPILPTDIADYTVEVDGNLYSSFAGCNDDTLIFYTYAVLEGLGNNGDYEITFWQIDGVTHTAVIADMNELTDSMNAWDPYAVWTNNPTTFTISTMNGTVGHYANMEVKHVDTGLDATMQTNFLETPFNTEVVVTGNGSHIVTISPNGDCCIDTIYVNIGTNCEPLFTGPYTIDVANCDTTGLFCTGLDQLTYNEYTVLDNGVIYSESPITCATDSVTFYDYAGYLGTGSGISFFMDNWVIDGISYNGVFNNIADLVNLMNSLDPLGNWMLDINSVQIIGGVVGKVYGDITWTEVSTNQNGVITPFAGNINGDVGLTLETGQHQLIFNESQTGCADTVIVNVNCPQPTDTLYIFTTVEFASSNQYCVSNLNLPGNIVSVINTCPDNSGNEVAFTIDTMTNCVHYDGLAIGQDTACLLICNDLGVCQPVCLVTIVTSNCQDIVVPTSIIEMGTSCEDEMEICLEGLDYTYINSHTIYENGKPYLTPTGTCDFDTVFAYRYKPLEAGTGPYQVDFWTINGLPVQGVANSIAALADSMSVWDPTSNWTMDTGGNVIYGGAYEVSYSNIMITDITLQTQYELNLSEYYIPSSASMYLIPGNYEIIVVDDSTGCSDTLQAMISCISPDIYLDTVFLMEIDTICLDTMELPGNITSIENFCDDGVGVNVDFTVIDGENCLITSGVNVGTDSACVVLCDDLGYCDTTYVYIAVEQMLELLPSAADDVDTTNINTPIIVNVIVNDTISGTLDTVYLLDPPIYGAVEWVNSGFEYVPDLGYCSTEEPDQFSYVVCNGLGCDTATVSIYVLCPEPEFYTGFSPNGDGINETFTITNIDQYPDNRLYVFNRWGEQVFYVQDYGNDWEGKWEGEDLPDGTYFYVFVTGRGKLFSGYVQINR